MRKPFPMTPAGILGLLALLGSTLTAEAAATQTIADPMPTTIQRLALQPIGALPPSQRLNLAIGLPARNRDALEEFVAEVSDPASPRYRQYLSYSEFTDRFGPTVEDYSELIDFARSHRLTITDTYRDRLVLTVEGSVADIESAFHIHLLTYNHPDEDRVFFAPDAEPTVEMSAKVEDIMGLDNYLKPLPAYVPTPSSGPLPADAGSGPGGSYRGYDFRHAYVPGTTLDGSGQRIGVLEFDSGFYQSDITDYEIACGLPTSTIVTPVLLDGYNGEPGFGGAEVWIDIEMEIAMAPNLAEVRVYEGDVLNHILSAMAADTTTLAFAASWYRYTINATTNTLWQQMAAQGQSFFNCSGDVDAYPSQPASPTDNPYITIVGGTHLLMTIGGNAYISESVWNVDPTHGLGSSGGISHIYTIPPWQAPISMATNQGSTTMRNLPDIGGVARNCWFTYGGGLSGAFDGTSLSTPLWAGYTALANQQAAADGCPSMGFMNPALYAIGGGDQADHYFHDCTTYNNTWTNSPTKWYAVAGYDLCVGFGSPTLDLISALLENGPCGIASVGPGASGASIPLAAPNPSSASSRVSFELKTAGQVRVDVVDVGGRIVRTLMSGMQPAGEYSVDWDTRDDGGRGVPAGVYLTRVETARGVAIGKVVVAR